MSFSKDISGTNKWLCFCYEFQEGLFLYKQVASPLLWCQQFIIQWQIMFKCYQKYLYLLNEHTKHNKYIEKYIPSIIPPV